MAPPTRTSLQKLRSERPDEPISPLVLIVSTDDDLHATAVRAALRRRGVPSRLLDLARFPGELSLTSGAGRGGDGPVLAPRRGPALRLRDVTSVWWRRPRPFVLHEELHGEDRRIFAFRECREAFDGMLRCLRVRWVNDPLREQAANHKPWQLALAERCGVHVPSTCITSDPRRARAFVASLRPGRAVFKSLQATAKDWRPTRLVDPRHLRRLDVVRFAPVIFQEYVEPGADVRVTVVGRRIFATEIDPRGTGSPADFRPGFDRARVAPVALPRPVAAGLRRLVDALGLAYAAIDLRRDRMGSYFFLEVNPSGQWLFVEERTGQPITEAVARLLASGR